MFSISTLSMTPQYYSNLGTFQLILAYQVFFSELARTINGFYNFEL